MSDVFVIKNNRLRIQDITGKNMLESGAKGGRFLKKTKEWSFPLSEMDILLKYLSCRSEFELDEAWYDIFPEYKCLRSIQ